MSKRLFDSSNSVLFFRHKVWQKKQKHCHNQEVGPLTGMLQEICVRVQSFD